MEGSGPSLSQPNFFLSPPHKQLLATVVGDAVAVVMGYTGSSSSSGVASLLSPSSWCWLLLCFLLSCCPCPHCPVVIWFVVVLPLSYHILIRWLALSFLSHFSLFPPTSNCLQQRLGVLSSQSSPVVCCSLLSTVRVRACSGVVTPIICVVVVVSTLDPTL